MYIRRRLLLFHQIYILANHFANSSSTLNLLVVKFLCTRLYSSLGSRKQQLDNMLYAMLASCNC